MPELAALATAAAALLIIFAWSLIFSRVLQAARGHVPGLFGPLFDALAAADTAIYNALRNWTDSAVQPLSTLFDRLVFGLDSLVFRPLDFARAVYALLVRLFEVTVPGAITTAEDRAYGLWQDAVGRIDGVYNAVEADLQQAGTTLRAGLSTLYSDLQQLGAYAQQLFAQAESDAQASLAAAESPINQLIGSESSRAREAEAALAGTLGSDLAQLVGEVNQALRGVEGYAGQLFEAAESDAQRLVNAERAFALGIGQVEKQDLQDLRDGKEWQLLTGLEEVGGAVVETGIADLVRLGRQAIRAEAGAAGELQSKLRPVIAAIRQGIEAGT